MAFKKETNKIVKCFITKSKVPKTVWVLCEDYMVKENLLESISSVVDFYCKISDSYTGSYIIRLRIHVTKLLAFLNECIISRELRNSALSLFKNEKSYLLIELDTNSTIDVTGSGKIQTLVNERLVCDVGMSYLSTLGGACSALGEADLLFAARAGEIAVMQFKIAVKTGDEPMMSRCKLYLALSLIQQGRLQNAKYIIAEQYKIAKKHEDQRLGNMCKGVLARMEYARNQLGLRRRMIS